MTGLDKVMILSLVAIGAADYSCYCNYSVEKHVYPTTSNSSRPLASLYEFDCKPSFPTPNLPPPWAAIQYKHQVGYMDGSKGDLQLQTCPGDPPADDLVPRTSALSSVSTTTKLSQQTTTLSSIPTTSLSTTPQMTQHITSKHPASSKLSTLTTKQTSSSNSVPSTVISSSQTSTHFTSSTQLNSSNYTLSSQPTTSKKPTLVNKKTTSLHSTHSLSSSKPSSMKQSTSTTRTNLSTKPASTTLTTLSSTERTPTTHTTLSTQSTSTKTLTPKTLRTSINTKTSQSTLSTAPSTLTVQSTSTTPSTVKETTSAKSTNKSTSTTQSTSVSLSTPASQSTSTSQSPSTTQSTTLSVTTEWESTVPTPVVGPEGRTYLCPYLVKHRTEMRYLVQYEGFCYELYPYEMKNWFDAEEYCRYEQGYLVTIPNRYIQEKIEYLLNRTHFQGSVWIGLHDLRTEGQWEWIDGTPHSPGSYDNWQPYHIDPVYSSEQDCALLDGRTGHWKEVVCDGFLLDSQRHSWVCQYSIP